MLAPAFAQHIAHLATLAYSPTLEDHLKRVPLPDATWRSLASDACTAALFRSRLTLCRNAIWSFCTCHRSEAPVYRSFSLSITKSFTPTMTRSLLQAPAGANAALAISAGNSRPRCTAERHRDARSPRNTSLSPAPSGQSAINEVGSRQRVNRVGHARLIRRLCC